MCTVIVRQQDSGRVLNIKKRSAEMFHGSGGGSVSMFSVPITCGNSSSLCIYMPLWACRSMHTYDRQLYQQQISVQPPSRLTHIRNPSALHLFVMSLAENVLTGNFRQARCWKLPCRSILNLGIVIYIEICSYTYIYRSSSDEKTCHAVQLFYNISVNFFFLNIYIYIGLGRGDCRGPGPKLYPHNGGHSSHTATTIDACAVYIAVALSINAFAICCMLSPSLLAFFHIVIVETCIYTCIYIFLPEHSQHSFSTDKHRRCGWCPYPVCSRPCFRVRILLCIIKIGNDMGSETVCMML